MAESRIIFAPVRGKTVRGEPGRYLQDVVLPYEGDECFVWPFGRGGDGYGQIHRDGRKRVVSRLVCESVYGPPPGPGYDAAHSCGNGHLACVNKRHLSWKTRAANLAEMVEHGNSTRGERQHGARLTEPQVLEIKRLLGTTSQAELARQFGVSRKTIHSIRSGQSWAWL
jgi:hypothetical protein